MKRAILLLSTCLLVLSISAQTKPIPPTSPQINTYTVVGDQLMMGSNFDVNDAANEMKAENGVYTLVKKSVLLDEGDYKYKVVGNHSYEVYQFPGNAMDQVLSIGAHALYDITFTFDPSKADEDATKLTAEATYLIPALAKYYVVGNGSASATWLYGKDWELAAQENLLEAGTITYTGVEPGTYEFQVTNGTWAQAWGHSKLDKKNSSPGHIQGENDNIKFELDVKADITIQFNGSMVVLLIDKEAYKPAITVYTVVGPEVAFGSHYDVNDTANDMKEEGSVYKWSKTVALTKGIYEYKVVGNHAYEAYEFPGPGMNKTFTVESEGSYLLEVVFNPAADDASDFKLVAQLTPSSVSVEEVEADFTVYVQNQTIIVSDAPEFQIYDLTGRNVTPLNGNLLGIYLVRVGDSVLKVLVQ